MLLIQKAISVRLQTVATKVTLHVAVLLPMEATSDPYWIAVMPMVSTTRVNMPLVEDILGSSRIVAMQLGHVRVLPSYLKNNESCKRFLSRLQELPGEWQKGYVNRMKRPS